jgi:hypothetical protein
MEFDLFGLSVKDLSSWNVTSRCNNSGPLYTMHLPSCLLLHHVLLLLLPSLHRHLLDIVVSDTQALMPCPSCRATLVSFALDALMTSAMLASSVIIDNIFDLIHYGMWTSHIVSVSGYKYYLVILDDHSHFVCTFPLCVKSDTFSTLSHFFAYVFTQFDRTIKVVQCDNDREFDNAASHAFFATKGLLLWMSCPYTSP